MTLPTLYKRTKTNSIQICDITTSTDTYTVSFGKLNGKMQTKTTICYPKNINRSNATTVEQQAVIEAQAKWNKKIKSGYSTSKEAPITVQLPMKVGKYQDYESKIKFPAIATIKYNGVNVIFRIVDNILKCYSRGGEEYQVPPHLKQPILNTLLAYRQSSINCELYSHNEYLQDIQAAVTKHNNLTSKLIAIAFDFPDLNLNFEKRHKVLQTITTMHVAYPEFIKVHNHTEIKSYLSHAMHNGYEGLVIKNLNGMYKYNIRTLSQFKYKLTQDAEFKIKAFSVDKNKHPVFVLESKGGDFKAKPKGTNEQRSALLQQAPNLIGKYATIEFETYSKLNKPLKPVFIQVRNCDKSGNPLE